MICSVILEILWNSANLWSIYKNSIQILFLYGKGIDFTEIFSDVSTRFAINMEFYCLKRGSLVLMPSRLHQNPLPIPLSFSLSIFSGSDIIFEWHQRHFSKKKIFYRLASYLLWIYFSKLKMYSVSHTEILIW